MLNVVTDVLRTVKRNVKRVMEEFSNYHIPKSRTFAAVVQHLQDHDIFIPTNHVILESFSVSHYC